MTSLDLAKNTDPSRNAHWWTRERFYLVNEKPVCHLDWKLGRLRLRSWMPRSFLSVSWEIHDRPAPKGKFRAWQIYLGWGKCDGTRTLALWAGQLGGPYLPECYVFTWTFAEMFAWRKRDLDLEPVWNNMAGS